MKVKIKYDKDFIIGKVDRKITGSFVEHLNRCVYEGIYEPTHPTADRLGFRKDVKTLIKEFGISLLRYPGGNFVSAYDWKDGIGPRDKRPVKWNLAWGTKETNQVGIDEFIQYAKELGSEIMMSVNMGTGTSKDAAELVEYCNVDGGTFYSDLRRKNGYENPYNIKIWCVGNEMDGPWQMGQMEAREYAIKYRETAKMMKSVCSDISLVACGSCSNESEHLSFGIWDRIVLEEAYEWIDYLSLHRYYGYDIEQKLLYPRIETLKDAPWMAKDLGEMIKTVLAAADYVKGIRKSDHEIMISFDELSILPHYAKCSDGYQYDVYSQYDAVLYGGLLCILLNNSDRVKINCQALLVNENGMFTTFTGGKTLIQTIAYAFRDIAACVNGNVLQQVGEWPEIETEHYGNVPCAVSSCIYLEEKKELILLVANNTLEQRLELEMTVAGFEEIVPVKWTELYTEDIYARNDAENPQRVYPIIKKLESMKNIAIRPHSWNVFQFTVK